MKNKGVTLIEMVIVVIILILLAIIAIWSSTRTSTEAELALLHSEFKAVYTGLLKINQEYNLEIFDDYTSGEHYNSVLTDDSDNIVPDWYVIYGMNDVRYSEEIMDNFGIKELKRNYKVNFKTLEVELLDGPVTVDKYEIDSYDDVKSLEESGVI